MVARNVVDSQRRSDPGSIPGGATQCDIFFSSIFYLLCSIFGLEVIILSQKDPFFDSFYCFFFGRAICSHRSFRSKKKPPSTSHAIVQRK